MSAVRMNIDKVLLYRGRSDWIFYCGTLATIQEKQKVSEIENNRMDANLTVPTPMGHLAKIKILEYGTIGWQAGG